MDDARYHSLTRRLQLARVSADLIAAPAWGAFVAEFDRQLADEWLTAGSDEDTRLCALRTAMAAIKTKLKRDAAEIKSIEADLERAHGS